MRTSSLIGALVSIAFVVLYGCGGGSKPKPVVQAVDTDRDGVEDALDCAPQDSRAWQVLAFAARNDDGDGASVNATGQLCVGASLPPNRLATAVLANEADCDDADPNTWVIRPYEGVDSDLDGHAVATSGTKCTGASLPAGFIATAPAAAVADCNDADPNAWAVLTYGGVDSDRDGYAVAGAGSRCTGSTLPSGYVANTPAATDTDCDDNDVQRWKLLTFAARDDDGDGYRVPASGSVCGQGILPATLFASTPTTAQLDCDDHDASLWNWHGVYRDADGDGVGAGSASYVCLGDGGFAPGFVTRGYDPEDDPGVPGAAAVSEFEIPNYLLVVAEDGDDDDPTQL